jgi:hypothetical protein
MAIVDFASVSDLLLAYDQGLITYREARELLGFENSQEVKMELRADMTPEAAERFRKEWLAKHGA